MTGIIARTKQSDHMNTKCQLTASKMQHVGLRLINKLFPRNMNNDEFNGKVCTRDHTMFIFALRNINEL